VPCSLGGGGNEACREVTFKTDPVRSSVHRQLRIIRVHAFPTNFFSLSPGQCTVRRPSADGTARGNQPRSKVIRVPYWPLRIINFLTTTNELKAKRMPRNIFCCDRPKLIVSIAKSGLFDPAGPKLARFNRLAIARKVSGAPSRGG
jgi:hypothetical protein